MKKPLASWLAQFAAAVLFTMTRNNDQSQRASSQIRGRIRGRIFRYPPIV